ncbi:unnamed protein product, partial [Chrysoparadoxa australica]
MFGRNKSKSRNNSPKGDKGDDATHDQLLKDCGVDLSSLEDLDRADVYVDESDPALLAELQDLGFKDDAEDEPPSHEAQLKAAEEALSAVANLGLDGDTTDEEENIMEG